VRFEWDRANREHIARHGVSTSEAEHVIESKPYHLSLEVRSAEIRVSVIGADPNQSDSVRGLYRQRRPHSRGNGSGGQP
jgi:uncharacterized DUF497 family protein